jgi:hypothetical protein
MPSLKISICRVAAKLHKPTVKPQTSHMMSEV